MFKRMEREFEKVQNVLLALIAIALGLMMVIIFLQTATRYVIFYSLTWSEELSRYLFVFLIMIGLTLAIKNDELISIDIIDRILPAKAEAVLDTLRKIIALFLSGFIAILCTKMFKLGMIQKSPAMGIPMIVMYGTVFLGYLFSMLTLILKVGEGVMEIFGKEGNGEEA